MPKKTKKEKIIAEYRRKLTYVYQPKTTVVPRAVTVAQPMDRAIKRDLVKTLLLAAGAIAGEVVLSRVVK